MTEEQQRHQEASTSPQKAQASPPKEHKSIHELQNQDYVSRLLAATPPYLYSAPVGPNNFFFSDILRSLVQARNNENARNLQLQQAAVMARRPRKRSWSQHRPYYEHLRDRKNLDEKTSSSEKPLELTNKQFMSMDAVKYSKPDTTAKESLCPKPSPDASLTENHDAMEGSPAVASMPPQDLVLPPPPPVWYPPIYPPYGIDPLHFFIDLRVSGHIYDRKKENVSPLTSAENNTLPSSESELGKSRHGSAFTVPVPRNESKGSTAMNLSASTSSSSTETSTKLESYSKYYDLRETKENQPNPKSNTNYVLQNLPRIYSQFAEGSKDIAADITYENDSKSDQDCEESTAENGCTIYRENSAHIDVEMVETIKLNNDDGGNSRQTSSDECNLTQHSE